MLEDARANFNMLLEKPFTVSEFIEHCNLALTSCFEDVTIEGEVASFKVNQGKWVFFDLKEGEMSVNCFMVLKQLNVQLEDGMKIQVRATPRVTNWGKFSLTVKSIIPKGEGSIKKSFELLKKKLTKLGFFDPSRKRKLPENIEKIAVISSKDAAGYADFIKILGERWGGLKIYTAHTQVQGLIAVEQILRAFDYINQNLEVDVIALIRGGGSADDLAIFNDERLVRAIVASRIPVITGIGHEVDESLADLAADVRASTPSNAAEYLTRDKQAEIMKMQNKLRNLRELILREITLEQANNLQKLKDAKQEILRQLEMELNRLKNSQKVLQTLNPENVLKQGYAILRGEVKVGNEITIERRQDCLRAEILEINSRE